MNWQFDHIAFNTPDQAPLQRLFGSLLNLRPGQRPPFSVPGTWLYQGDKALVHLIEKADIAKPLLSHIALRTNADVTQVMAQVQASGLSHGISEVPGSGDLQIFVQLPAGLLLELVVTARNENMLPAQTQPDLLQTA